jgi:uncharacterized protein DUF4255/carboxypeptidase family protein
MIHVVDEALRALLHRELRSLPSGPPPVSFASPAADTSGEEPTISLFLYEVREDIEVRARGRFIERDKDRGTATVTRPAVYLRLHYAVSVRPEQDHSLLAAALTALFRYPTLDLRAWLDPDSDVGRLAASLQNPQPFPLLPAQEGLPPDPAQFWGAVGCAPRPAFSLLVRATLEPHAPVETPLVRRADTSLAIEGSGASSAGVVHWVALAGTVTVTTAEGSAPVAGAHVQLLDTGLAAITDEKGFYFFTNLQPGAYTVRAWANGLTAAAERVLVRGQAGREYTSQDLTLRRAPLSGTVRRAPGARPVPSAAVRAGGGQAVSDSEGYYAFDRLPAGEHEVCVTVPGFREEVRKVVVNAEDNRPPVADFLLHPVALSGVVLDRRTRAGIPGGRVTVPGYGEVAADAEGRFSVPHLPPGRYRIVAEGKGYLPGEQHLRLEPRTVHDAPAGTVVLLELEPERGGE